MDIRIDCFVSGVFAAVLHVARFVGIAPLRFVKEKSRWRIRSSTGWAIYGYIIITITGVIIIGMVITELQFEPEKTYRMQTKTRCVVGIVDIIILLAIAGTAVFGAPGQMRFMIAFLNKAQKINYDLNIRHGPMYLERKKTFLFIAWLIISVVFPCCAQAQKLILSHQYHFESIVWFCRMFSFYYVLFWILLMHGMMFIIRTLHVMYIFRAINDQLRTLVYVLAIADFDMLPFIVPFNCRQFKVNKFFCGLSVVDSGLSDGVRKTARPHHETLHRLSVAYMQACELVREVERCYGPSLLMMLGFYLMRLIMSSYYLIGYLLYHEMLQNDVKMYMMLVLVQLIWCVFHLMNLVLINEPCHLTHKENEITRQMVSRLMRCTLSAHDPLAGELELFFRQIILVTATYSPMKVTMMSRSLVVTIIASITTYLVVIVQL